MGMFERVFFVPQAGVGTVASTGKTQTKIFISTTSPDRVLAGLLIQFGATITGTAPGTARGISQVITNVEITEEDGTVHHVDGAALLLSSFDLITHLGQINYQAALDTVTGATGVTAVAQYGICGPFKGNSFTVVFNINSATATGYTAVSGASYTATICTLEVAKVTHYTATGNPKKPNVNATIQPIDYPVINGRYVVDSKYVGAVNCLAAYFGTDNVELSTTVKTFKVANVSFTPQQCQMAEDALNASLPDGIATGATFAGNATTPPKNVETGNALGLGLFGGPTGGPLVVALGASQTILLLERQQR